MFGGGAIDTYGHGESIYNMIPPKEIPQERPPMYKSKHNPQLPPTATTLGGAQTSHPTCTGASMNISGSASGKIVPTKQGRTMGKPVGSMKNVPSDYMKGGAKTSKVQSLKQITASCPNLLQPSALKPKLKPDVPKLSEAPPVMNLVSSKNFVVANAVETILAAPKKSQQGAKDYLRKDDYGKVPKYLTNIKQDIDAEYEYILQLQEQEESAARDACAPLDEQERQSIIAGLKAKWEQVNTEYQGATHLTVLDSAGKKYRKEKYEAELSNIEKDIEKLNRKNIMIARDNFGY